jgi:hypothetical protein
MAMPMHTELGKLIHVLNPYSDAMEFPQDQASQVTTDALKLPAADKDIPKIQVEIDNYKGEWTFRGQIHKIERGLRITYRYPVLNNDKKPTGVFATEHLLIGYAGGDGS